MTRNGKYVSQYDRRVKLVADTLMRHTKLDEAAALEVAAHILDAIDRTPEKSR
jgi:Family of unknown function (DUF6307)